LGPRRRQPCPLSLASRIVPLHAFPPPIVSACVRARPSCLPMARQGCRGPARPPAGASLSCPRGRVPRPSGPRGTGPSQPVEQVYADGHGRPPLRKAVHTVYTNHAGPPHATERPTRRAPGTSCGGQQRRRAPALLPGRPASCCRLRARGDVDRSRRPSPSRIPPTASHSADQRKRALGTAPVLERACVCNESAGVSTDPRRAPARLSARERLRSATLMPMAAMSLTLASDGLQAGI
jgi:hypothetical protein